MSETGHFLGLRGTWQSQVPMREHVSWRAGGPARRAYTPADIDDLAACLKQLPADEPLLFAGLGSNLLVRDGGFDGTVILLHGTLRGLSVEPSDPDLVYAEAGVASPKLARFAAGNGRVGAEFLAGIPGTVGGALAMNAGCYGSETWGSVAKVLVIDRRGELRMRTPEDYEIGYRHVAARHPEAEPACFVAAWFRFAAGDGEKAREVIRALLAKRLQTQPLQWPNAGSVFRNPPGDHAARLIEAAGLKGFRIGGAEVSRKHANFIINPESDASAADVEAVIAHVQQTVAAQFGVALVQEVRIVGKQA